MKSKCQLIFHMDANFSNIFYLRLAQPVHVVPEDVDGWLYTLAGEPQWLRRHKAGNEVGVAGGRGCRESRGKVFNFLTLCLVKAMFQKNSEEVAEHPVTMRGNSSE